MPIIRKPAKVELANSESYKQSIQFYENSLPYKFLYSF